MQETISDEKGQALIWALITLTVAAVVIVPFLLFLNSNVLISGKRHTKVWEIYSTDSGVEYAIYEIQNFSQTLGVDQIGATAVVTLSANGVPLRVNEEIITAMIENSTPVAPDYVIFANSTTCPNAIDWGSSSTTIGGDIHSNNDISISGASKEMTGTMEYFTSVDFQGGVTVTFNTLPNPVVSTVMTWPVSYDINDYKPGGSIANQAQAAGKYHIITGTLNVPPDSLEEGLYYVTENVQINSSPSPLTVTIVAEGSVKFNFNGEYTAYTSDELLFFSNKNAPIPDCYDEVVRVTGTNKELHGNIYGPHGKIYLSGAGNEDVKLLGHTIEFQGSGLGSTATSSLEDRSLLPPGCFYYDIISRSGGTETTARVLMCSNEPNVLSWLVE